MQSHKLKKLLGMSVLASVVCLASGYSFASNVQVGRFLTVQNGAVASQNNPLDQSFMLTLPSSINTVGGAMSYILSNTGFTLVQIKYRSKSVSDLFNQRLALSDRTLGPITVLQALSALAGNAYQVLIDPQHRAISFLLKPKYTRLYDTSLRNSQ